MRCAICVTAAYICSPLATLTVCKARRALLHARNSPDTAEVFAILATLAVCETRRTVWYAMHGATATAVLHVLIDDVLPVAERLPAIVGARRGAVFGRR